MAIGVTVLVICILVAAIWIVIEVQRFKHKLFAIFLIGLILFLYISGTFVLKGNEIDLKTIPGVMKAGNIYLSWLGTAAGNFKTITANVVKMDWGINQPIEEKNK